MSLFGLAMVGYKPYDMVYTEFNFSPRLCTVRYCQSVATKRLTTIWSVALHYNYYVAFISVCSVCNDEPCTEVWRNASLQQDTVIGPTATREQFE
jgi:hypothetical protein